jgi:hypothetical protein
MPSAIEPLHCAWPWVKRPEMVASSACAAGEPEASVDEGVAFCAPEHAATL